VVTVVMLPVNKAIMGPSMQHFFFSSSNVMPPDDNRMIETCCGINIGRAEEEMLH
jgi:hypothetical protein